ncbi:tyrosine-type recombinase/integrase [Dactylosporangium sp. CA-152071]|uniref:tyrosine-type recombinase/integrase n=1 Tax=Dactylosporangium sp. CA-152071 TaxID=3239933 RepID=UPI003D941C00
MHRDHQGRERSAGTFTNKKQANKAWQKAETDIAAGKIGDPKRGRQKLARYVTAEWFPNHVIEATTRENYTCLINKYLLPELGKMRMVDVLPTHTREWISTLQTKYCVNPPTIRQCKVIFDAIFTTAFNDQITFLHPGKGVKTPPVAKKTRRIITTEQFDRIYLGLEDDTLRLLVETDIESGLRWGELTELRPKDIDFATGMLTVSRAVVQLKAKDRPGGVRFVVKEYPKDKEWRQLRLADHLLDKLKDRISTLGLEPDDLLLEMPQVREARRRTLPEVLPDPDTLGLTEPNEKGRVYKHGTATAYGAGRCRCQHCRNAVAAYRASRRAAGKDAPRAARTVDTDGHIPGDWFRKGPWKRALKAANLDFHVTPHGMRHAHASWLLAGGADLVVVKNRLGHGTISTTELYLHALPGGDDAALQALAAIRGRIASAPEAQAPVSTAPDASDMAAMMAKVSEMYELMKASRPAAAA